MKLLEVGVLSQISNQILKANVFNDENFGRKMVRIFMNVFFIS